MTHMYSFLLHYPTHIVPRVYTEVCRDFFLAQPMPGFPGTLRKECLPPQHKHSLPTLCSPPHYHTLPHTTTYCHTLPHFTTHYHAVNALPQYNRVKHILANPEHTIHPVDINTPSTTQVDNPSLPCLSIRNDKVSQHRGGHNI